MASVVSPNNSPDMGCGASSGRLVGTHDGYKEGDSRAFFDGFVQDVQTLLRTTPHVNARQSPYQGGGPNRFELEDTQLPWDTDYDGYRPVEYNAPILMKDPRPCWADPLDASTLIFNTFDAVKKYERTSHEGSFGLNERNEPMNPRGRTGMCGRGLLGRWGPNHAADPVITKWARDDSGNKIIDDQGQPILEFVAIKRKDTGEWAIPGGMVDAGENVSLTLKREFGEETMNSMELPQAEQDKLMAELDTVFKSGVRVYSGYVDDIRNTDNAWMETTCVNFHDEVGTSFSKFKLAAGDDAGEVAWTKYHEDIRLYATHATFMETVFKMRLALHFHQQKTYDVTKTTATGRHTTWL